MSEQKVERWTDYDRAIFKLLDAAADQQPDGLVEGGSGLGVVTLVGPTQCGKTTLIQDYAKAKGVELITSFLGCDDSTDVAGYPVRTTDSAGRATLDFTNPSIIPSRLLRPEARGKFIVFLDELDKVDKQTLSPILSFLGERKIRDRLIQPYTVICAMNPPKRAMPEPCLSRLLMVDYPGPDYNVWDRAALKPMEAYLGHLDLLPDHNYHVEPIGGFGGAHRVTKWALTRKIFWADYVVQDMILNGSLATLDAESTRAKLRDIPTEPVMDWATTATPTEVAAGILYYLGTATPDQAEQLQSILMRRASEDTTGEMATALDVFYGLRKPASPLGSLESHGDHKADEVRVKAASKLMLKRFTRDWRKAQQTHDD